MRSRRYKNRLYRFLHNLGESPIELLEALQFLVLGWVLFRVLVGFGGFLAYAEPMLEASAGLLVLAALHALVVAFRKDKPGPGWELLLPLPFILYAWAHYQGLSAAPWQAGLLLTVFVQAYALYFLVFNSIHGSRSGLWVLSMCQLVVVIALLTAFFQFYQFPEWMVTMERERHPAYLDGAAGLLLDPLSLGALLLLFWPVSVIIVGLPRFSGPVRMLNGFYILAMLVGILLSAHRPGILMLLFVMLLLPLFLSRQWEMRWKFWRYGFIAMLVALPAFWFATDVLRQRLMRLWDSPQDLLGEAGLSAARGLFADSPLFGQGLGSFGLLWESYRPQGVEGTSLYPVSSYADILAETGLVGLACLALPVALLLLRGLMAWKRLPYLALNKDVKERMDRFPRGHPSRARFERSHGRAPTAKIVLGSLLLGLMAFFGYIGWDYSYKLPLHLFLIACLLAVLAAFSRRGPAGAPGRVVGLATGVVPLLLAAWAVAFGVPRFYSQYLVFTTDEQLDYLLDNPDRIFLDPGALTAVLQGYEGAARLNPDHAGAWNGTGRTLLARLYADLWSPAELATEAAPAFERALELAPQSWLAHYEMARTLAILGAGEARIEGHLRQAMELAPYRTEPPALLGSLILLRDVRSAEGRALVEAALALDPGYQPVQNTMRRIELSLRQARTGEQAGQVEGVFSESLLAEQFEVVGNPRERVMGAGAMPRQVDVIPTPDS
jgi:tetratricopeptide (TPR) repeat protein